MNHKVLIFGATSMVGKHIVQLLENNNVTIVTRNNSSDSISTNHETVIYDLTKDKWVHNETKFDFCIFCADTNLIKNFPKNLEIGHMILISSASRVLKKSSTDSDDCSLVTELAEAERYIFDHFASYNIIRPTWIFNGENDKISNQIAKLAKLTRIFPFTTNPRGKRNPIDPGTLATVIQYFLNPSLRDQRAEFNVGGNKNFQYADLIKIILEKQKIKFKGLYLPLPIYRVVLYVLHLFNFCTGIKIFMFKHMEEDLSISNLDLPDDLQKLIMTQSNSFWTSFYEK